MKVRAAPSSPAIIVALVRVLHDRIEAVPHDDIMAIMETLHTVSPDAAEALANLMVCVSPLDIAVSKKEAPN